MNRTEYETFCDGLAPLPVEGARLPDRTPRTVLYGFTSDRDTFHVYLDEDGLLQRVIYNLDGFLLSHGTERNLSAWDFIPDKRVYPETCDLEFCRMLREAQVNIPFTAFGEREPALWYGKRKAELIAIDAQDRLPKVPIEIAELGLEGLPDSLSPYHVEGDLENQLSALIDELMLPAYRCAKYKGERSTLDQRLESLPNNVNWKINRWMKSVFPGQPALTAFCMPEAEARALVAKVKTMLDNQLGLTLA